MPGPFRAEHEKSRITLRAFNGVGDARHVGNIAGLHLKGDRETGSD